MYTQHILYSTTTSTTAGIVVLVMPYLNSAVLAAG